MVPANEGRGNREPYTDSVYTGDSSRTQSSGVFIRIKTVIPGISNKLKHTLAIQSENNLYFYWTIPRSMDT